MLIAEDVGNTVWRVSGHPKGGHLSRHMIDRQIPRISS
jgi:hypothetical protein